MKSARTDPRRGSGRGSIAPFGLALLLALVVALPSGAATLNEATDAYWDADYEGSLQILNQLISSKGAPALSVWILKGRCHVALAQNSRAQDAFCEVLRLDPDWVPDETEMTSDEVEIGRQAIRNCPKLSAAPKPDIAIPAMGRATPWYQNKMILIPAAAVVVGGIAAVALSGGGDDAGDGVLPGFPATP